MKSLVPGPSGNTNIVCEGSLRTADVFPVVAFLPPKIDVIFRRKRSNDRKYVFGSQATVKAAVRMFVKSAVIAEIVTKARY